MGVASGCGDQEVDVASGSGCNLWVWLVGVVVRRYTESAKENDLGLSCNATFSYFFHFIMSVTRSSLSSTLSNDTLSTGVAR